MQSQATSSKLNKFIAFITINFFKGSVEVRQDQTRNGGFGGICSTCYKWTLASCCQGTDG